MTINSKRRRSGFALVAVLALFAMAGSMFVVWTRSVLQQHQLTRQAHHRTQAEWLADAALARAAARLASDPDYEGEVWELTPEDSPLPDAAEVTIAVAADDSARTASATVQSPPGDECLIRVTRVASLADAPFDQETNPSPGDT